jgi:hypothetical protein
MDAIHRQPEEHAANRAGEMPPRLVPDNVLSQFRVRIGKPMEDFKALPEGASIYDPYEVSVKRLARQPFGVAHRGMLNLDNGAFFRLDVGAVDFTVGRHMRDLPEGLRKPVLPFPMPGCLVLPPGGEQLRRPA